MATFASLIAERATAYMVAPTSEASEARYDDLEAVISELRAKIRSLSSETGLVQFAPDLQLSSGDRPDTSLRWQWQSSAGWVKAVTTSGFVHGVNVEVWEGGADPEQDTILGLALMSESELY